MTTFSYFGKGKLSSELYTDLALDIMRKKREEPFFLYLSYSMIHTPYQDVNKQNSKIVHYDKGVRDGMIEALDESVGRILQVLNMVLS